MLGLYLASPLTRDSYLSSKAAAVMAVLGLVTLGPPLFMLLARTIAGTGPDGPAAVSRAAVEDGAGRDRDRRAAGRAVARRRQHHHPTGRRVGRHHPDPDRLGRRRARRCSTAGDTGRRRLRAQPLRPALRAGAPDLRRRRRVSIVPPASRPACSSRRTWAGPSPSARSAGCATSASRSPDDRRRAPRPRRPTT